MKRKINPGPSGLQPTVAGREILLVGVPEAGCMASMAPLVVGMRQLLG